MPTPARASKPPPEDLSVFGRPYVLQTEAPIGDLEFAYGLCDTANATIHLRNDMTALDLRDTTLHEVFHAIRDAQGRQYGGEVEEDYVRSLATGLALVLQANPEFAKWLLALPRKNT